ncbi:hypothetical protein FHD02_14905 [Citrobacter sp. EC_71]|nr:YecR family lipoprotein [Citrobacter sp. EC_71]MBW9352874.1 hypothetical protein [Citrobacter sp. EC_71]
MTPVGGSKDDGIIRIGYSYGAFEKTNIDLMQAQSQAAQKCRVPAARL